MEAVSIERVHVFESCTVSREGAVNLSRDASLPARDLCVCTFLYACLSTGHSLAGRCRPIHSTKGNTLANTLDSGPSSVVRTELLESLMRARFMEALRTHRTCGHCCRGTAALMVWLWAWFFQASILAFSLSLVIQAALSALGIWKLPLCLLPLPSRSLIPSGGTQTLPSIPTLPEGCDHLDLFVHIFAFCMASPSELLREREQELRSFLAERKHLVVTLTLF